MVVNNPNNWHWVDKNVLPWSMTYITEKLGDLQLKGLDDDTSVVIVKDATTVTGDSDLSQRKNKAIVIYDMKIKFHVKAVKNDASEDSEKEPFKTDVELLEFIHDMDEDDYQFNIVNKSLDDGYKQHLRKVVFPEVIAVLSKYQDDVIGEHAGDLKHYEK